jgi:nucleoside-diphosphate-sugar epimerase
LKTYLITGVNGYIGKDLALNLLREDNIVIGVGRLETPKLHVSNKNFIYLNLDLTDLDFISQIDKFEFNGVFHLASQQPSNKNITYDDFYRSNVLTTIILSNYFNKKKLDFFLYTSTVSVFGNNNEIIYENTKPNPLNYYGLTKYIAESILQIESINFESKLIICRLQSVFGKDDGYGIVYTFYEALKKNEEIEIFSNGTISRNLILLDDVIKALVTISKNFNKVENFEIFNIASSNSMKTVEIASLIKHHLQSNSIINCVDKKYMFDWDVFVSNKKFTNYFNIELSSMEDAIFSYINRKDDI